MPRLPSPGHSGKPTPTQDPGREFWQQVRKWHCSEWRSKEVSLLRQYCAVLGVLCERLEHRLSMQDPVHPHQCIVLRAWPSSPHMLYQKSEFLKQRLLRIK